VPTIGEYLPGAQVNDGLGIWPAAGTPEPVVAPLLAEINHGWRCPMSESVSLGGRRRAPDRHPRGIRRRERSLLDYSGDD